MLWFYERDNERLRIEQRYDNVTQTFELTLHYSEGETEVTRFQTLEAFRQALLELDRRLERERWNGTGGPVLLAEGWPDKPLT